MATAKGKTEMESACSSFRIKILKTDASLSADLETMLSLKLKIEDYDQDIKHTKIVHWMRQKMTVLS